MIQIRTNIIQTPNFGLEIAEIEKWDSLIEQKINGYFSDRLLADWTYSFWKIFSDQTDRVEFKKPKKISKSRLTEYYCWLPTPPERHADWRFYVDCLQIALQEWLKNTFQITASEFETFWTEVQTVFVPQKNLCTHPDCLQMVEKTQEENEFLKEKIQLLEGKIKDLEEKIELLRK